MSSTTSSPNANSYSKSCRVCLDPAYNQGISLRNDSALLSLFELCVGKVDFIYCPPILCGKCANEVVQFAKFKRKCTESEDYWKSMNQKLELEIYTDNLLSDDIKSESEDGYCENLSPSPLSSQEEETFNQKEIILNSNKLFSGSDEEISYSEDIETDIPNNVKFKKGSNVYKCAKCKCEYRKMKWLMNHLEVCKKVNKMKSQKILKKNLKSSKLEDYECGLCPWLCTKNKLKPHLLEHWNNNELNCQLCDYSGRDFADMVTHRYEHFPNLAVSCLSCDKKFISLKSLQFHFRSVHLHKDGGWCSFCNETFKMCKTWKRHELLHTSSNVFICDLCGRKYLYRYQIQEHLIDHSDVKQYVCETCGRGFKRMSQLKAHVTNMHKPSTPVVCSHCKKTFKNQEKLDLHWRKLKQNKPFECSICLKKYALECELKSHLFWHTDERPHVCQLCGSKYKAKGQLKVHMQSHTGEKPYKCEFCDKSFYTGTQVRRHSSVHTGVRAHKCLYCHRSFHNRKVMIAHSLQHKVEGKSKIVP